MRRGFTTVELLVVCVVVLILAGMIMGGLSLLRKQQRKMTSTNTLIAMTQAIDKYLADYGILGDAKNADSSDFVAKPWLYLGVRPIQAGKEPYLDFKPKDLRKSDAGSYVAVSDLTDGEHLVDGFGLVIGLTIVNGTARGQPVGSYSHPESITITSSAGTPDNSNDDIVFIFERSAAAWRRLR